MSWSSLLIVVSFGSIEAIVQRWWFVGIGKHALDAGKRRNSQTTTIKVALNSG